MAKSTWLIIIQFWILFLHTVIIRCCSATSITNFFNEEAWPSISVQRQNAIRSQRDIMRNITIDQIPYVGVDLRKVLFNQESIDRINEVNEQYSSKLFKVNETEALLNNLSSLFNTGLQTMVLDLEIRNNTWMIVETNITFQQYLTILQQFLIESHYDLSANIQVLLLNIQNNTNVTINSNSSNTTNMTHLFDTYLGSNYIFTPKDFLSHQYANFSITKIPRWPTAQEFLFTNNNRLIIAEITSQLNLTENPYIFPGETLHYETMYSTLPCPRTNSEINQMQKISWRFLNSQFTPTNITKCIDCGLSPIISNPYDISNITTIVKLIIPSIVWTWANNEPRLSNSKLLMGKDSIKIYNCAKIKYLSSNSTLTWYVGDCYNKLSGLCKKDNTNDDWLVTSSEMSFFHFDDNINSPCPDGYNFSLPITPLESLSLSFYLNNSDFSFYDEKEFWINLNSISVSNCWVIGENTMCPYRSEISTRNFLEMILPISIVSFLLLVAVFYLSLLTIPIHDNRKNWRTIVSQVSKSEFEGVPS
ncbi:Mtc6p PWA37_002368 [Arxiozyma heterogenica]|uniref:Maintenance of telomere capping protein 6 n=1 Tax=Arxiozyma heterogenica TaxID=278026 RepID=A0AAN7WQ14_9SACH|nr:hypothetical protein RI543_000514 [Kazachstania heterogenica]